MSLLLAHDYPGNIRELENIIEHGFVLCSEGEIEVSHLPGYLSQHGNGQSTARLSMQESVGLSEKETIVEALKKNNYNRLAAAKDLGVHKSTLFRKVRKYQIILPEIDGRSGHKESR
jgi:transcriptional regulator with PAS, ATPase and Fis domain